MELRDYLRIVRRQWILIAVVGGIVVATAALITLRTTPLYASTSTLFVSTSAGEDAATAYQGGLFSQQRVRSYADLIDGESIAGSVRDSLGLERSVDEVQEAISATVVPDTVLLDLTATDPSPQGAQDLATEVGVRFAELVEELETPPGGGEATIKVTVVDAADLPDEPVSPRPVRNIGLALVLGLLLGFGLAVLREVLDTSVKSSAQLAELGAPPLGLTVYDSASSKQPIIVDGSSHGPQSEAFRQIRTNLQFVDVDNPPRAVVVTSSLPGEGKSSTSINLALTLSMAGVRTVLVDADLRRPKIDEYMNLVGAVGLTTVLAGQASLDDVLQPYGDAGLTVLPAGAIPPNPSELLGSRHMGELLAELVARFDLVVLDSPPLLPVTDAAVLSRIAGGAILVTRHGKTTHEQVGRSIEALRSVGARLYGGVLTMAPAKGPDAYGYGYGYGYAPVQDRPAQGPAEPKPQHSVHPEPVRR
jgi:capsular exopolysaccharide synthesis family protein